MKYLEEVQVSVQEWEGLMEGLDMRKAMGLDDVCLEEYSKQLADMT